MLEAWEQKFVVFHVCRQYTTVHAQRKLDKNKMVGFDLEIFLYLRALS